MFYSEAVYRTLGDLSINVEFGDEHDLRLNFRVMAFENALRANPIKGIRDIVPINATLGIYYDPLVISREKLIASLKEMEQTLAELIKVPSRLFKVPLWYNDPWSQECAAAHGAPNSLEYLAELNNMTVEEIIRIHSGTVWWVSAVGWMPACWQSMPLEPAAALKGGKYPTPRKWTPKRTIGTIGRLTTYYPTRAPGGYQPIANTPVDFYDPEVPYPIFEGRPVIPRVSDRHRYVPIDEATYWEIRGAYESGTYEYEVVEELYQVQEYVNRITAFQKTLDEQESKGGRA
jgi:allophanate hydrolase subunit 1